MKSLLRRPGTVRTSGVWSSRGPYTRPKGVRILVRPKDKPVPVDGKVTCPYTLNGIGLL